MTQKRVAFLGLGRMGIGMAGRLLDAGFDVAVYNRTADKAAPLVERGARSAGSPRDAAEGADAAISMVADDAASRAVWFGDDGALAALAPGSFATKAKAAVDRLRAAGHKVGLVRPRLLRPFPEAALRAALKGVKGVAVVDQNLSMGKGGILFAEVASALYGLDGAPVLVSFIGGLGGRDIDADDFAEMAAVTQKAADTGEAPPPRLLFDADELAEVRKLQTLAAVEWSKESEPEPEPKSEEAAS